MRLLPFILFTCFSCLAFGQSLQELEQNMATCQETIGAAETVGERLKASDDFEKLLIEAFGYEEAMVYAFNALPKVARHSAGDGSFRIFNWNIPLDGERNAYRMYVLFPKGKYQRFDDAGELLRQDESAVLEADEWYGALYYDMREVKTKGKKYYTLLGWEGNDELTTKKVLDVMVIEKKNKATLGFPLFENEGKLAHRRVFEFADDVVMNLKWLEPKDMIIFDRLEPTVQNLVDNYAFYGPSTSFDGYAWRNGMWELNEFVDMTRPKGAGAQFNFPARPDFQRKREKKNPLIGE